MIKFTEDREQIINLWCSVFDTDTREDVEFFLDNKNNIDCLGYFTKDNKLVSMLFLCECTFNNLKGKYVYAVCTYKEHRGKGYSSALINEAKKYMNDFLWLIPADDSLFDFYHKFGFKTKLYSDKNLNITIKFYENNDITEYLYAGSDYKYPKGMVLSEIPFPDGNTGFKTFDI